MYVVSRLAVVRATRLLLCALASALLVRAGVVSADASQFDDSRSLQDQIQTLLARDSGGSFDPAVLLALSSLYLDLGDTESDAQRRSAAYQEGARLAKRILDTRDDNAEAHYLYAANLGSQMQLKGLVASMTAVREIKSHVARALDVKPDHPPSLHMMGMILERLPSLLGGDPKAALQYLEQAVRLDPGYAHARLDLAKAYVARGHSASARRELARLLEQGEERRAARYVAEAKRLLASIASDR